MNVRLSLFYLHTDHFLGSHESLVSPASPASNASNGGIYSVRIGLPSYVLEQQICYSLGTKFLSGRCSGKNGLSLFKSA